MFLAFSLDIDFLDAPMGSLFTNQLITVTSKTNRNCLTCSRKYSEKHKNSNGISISWWRTGYWYNSIAKMSILRSNLYRCIIEVSHKNLQFKVMTIKWSSGSWVTVESLFISNGIHTIHFINEAHSHQMLNNFMHGWMLVTTSSNWMPVLTVNENIASLFGTVGNFCPLHDHRCVQSEVINHNLT